jgi:hypothetical protein
MSFIFTFLEMVKMPEVYAEAVREAVGNEFVFRTKLGGGEGGRGARGGTKMWDMFSK